MKGISDYLLSMLIEEGTVTRAEIKDFIRIIKEPSSYATIRIVVPKDAGIAFLKDHIQADEIKAMKFRRVRIVDAQWRVGETLVNLGDNKPGFIYREDSHSTFHLDQVVGYRDLGLRFSFKADTLASGFTRDVFFRQPDWVELEFAGVLLK
ncbi:hypothetical protein [Pectobacterium phage vB_ParM-25]|uniref:Uncharacterized protein n=1 Tax=Serratia phage vB_SmaM_Yaphecito TaxID=2777368 RepID=A0A7T3NBY8_9CAUD|nr:hypothetical protein [Serratia phage vB_SmaM_Yaphecito]UCR74781.1 hypothetical protein [Serratia phage BUCT660]URG14043.1 hypothetical protein [Pectobacterium phage vB_ParM-25]